MMIEPMTKLLDVRNAVVSTFIECFRLCCFWLSRLVTTISPTISKNVIAILSKKGIAFTAPFVASGKNLRNVEIGIVNKAPINAALAVVFRQNIPNRKMASTPGEKKPTYSCIN